MVRVLGLIPARGGSKRIYRKNIRPVAGHPLIEWTIRDALNSKLITDIYVSSDCNIILNTARGLGVNAIKRPKKLAGDYSQLEEVIQHALQTLGDYDYVVTMQPTTPFREPGILDIGIRQIIEDKSDSLIFVTELRRFIWSRDMKPINYNPTNRIRSQDKSWELVEYGDYICRRDTIEKYGSRIGGKVSYCLGSQLSYFDIDTELDLKIANAIATGLELDVME